MKPIIKYRGGKSREIPQFISYIPRDFHTYFEPFLGGGAVFFHLEPQHAVLNDVNLRLMTFYRELRDRYPEMRIQLDELQAAYTRNQEDYLQRKVLAPEERIPNDNEALYYQMRELFNHPTDQYLDSVLYFFINKTAYSGMIRYNNNGEYNVPFGRYPNFNTRLITERHHQLLLRSELLCADYRESFHQATERDFMFLDPPYDCVFNDYGNVDMSNGFDEEQHRRLANDFRNLTCRAVMVIGRTPLTAELYQEFIVGQYDKTYAVNIRNRFNANSVHIIVRNFH